MKTLITYLMVLFSISLASASSLACNFKCDRIPAPDEVLVYEKEDSVSGLNASSIKVLVWNIYKQRKSQFWSEYQKLSKDSDIQIIQENILDDEFPTVLVPPYSIAHATNFFMKNEVRTGVSNISKATARSVASYVTEDLEAWVKAPKAIVATTYKLDGHNQDLLVLNIHGINFKGDDALLRQLQGVESLKKHKGPVIFAGDFNTKNDDRHELTEKYLAEYGLSKVDIKMSKKKVLDLAFVRGLDVVSAKEVKSKGSDHPALVLELKLPQ